MIFCHIYDIVLTYQGDAQSDAFDWLYILFKMLHCTPGYGDFIFWERLNIQFKISSKLYLCKLSSFCKIMFLSSLMHITPYHPSLSLNIH